MWPKPAGAAGARPSPEQGFDVIECVLDEMVGEDALPRPGDLGGVGRERREEADEILVGGVDGPTVPEVMRTGDVARGPGRAVQHRLEEHHPKPSERLFMT